MNFQRVITINDADFYLDSAFKQANKRADIVRDLKIRKTKLGRTDKSKTVEIEKLNQINKTLSKFLQKILEGYPSINSLPDFYRDLLILHLDYVALKKSLGSVLWAKTQIQTITKKQLSKIKRATSIANINQERRAYYGRVCSVMKQIDKHLAYLEGSRRVMKAFPDVKEGIITISICGLPNVGKSTLLKRITNANPEIKEYPFTTKGLNMGSIKTVTREFQVIDTPGTLDRPSSKTNIIEKQAYLVLKHVTNVILFMFDPSETCGYSIEEQYNVFSGIIANPIVKSKSIPIYVILNKSDQEAHRLNELKEKLAKKKEYIQECITISAEKSINTEHIKEIITKTKRIQQVNSL